MMLTRRRQKHSFFQKIPGQIYLWLAVLIFGASSAVTRKLTEIGSQNFIDGRNPISLCNVLFVGNLCALIVQIFIYRRQWNKKNLQRMSKKEWIALIVIAILSGALAPGLIFQALALTNVNNVVLIGRLEPPLTLALSIWLLKERVNIWSITGALIAFVGVSLTIILQSPQTAMMHVGGFHLGFGEILVVTAAIALAIATIFNKKYTSKVPLGIYSVVRTSLGTVVFFFLALILYGHNHFMDVFSPFLWKWMLVYGAVIVVLGQSLWIQGLKVSTVSVASLVGSGTPVVGIIAAYLVLGEAPTQAQYIGGSLILAGIFLSQFGNLRQSSHKAKSSRLSSTQAEKKVETFMGFKGI